MLPVLASGGVNGGNDSRTLALLHGNGADASPTFTDSSSYGRTVSVFGSAQIDTAQSKFGGASMLFNGTTDYATMPDSTDWLQTDSFTWECWFRASSVTGGRAILSQTTTDGSHENAIYIYNGTLHWAYYETGAYRWDLTTPGLVTNTWYHMAAVKNGNNQILYLDGTAVASASSSFTMLDISSPLYIGQLGVTVAHYYWSGWIEEARFSDVARWTTPNFPLPTVAYY